MKQCGVCYESVEMRGKDGRLVNEMWGTNGV